MIPVKQRITDHNPERGQYGDCFKCCVASILELPYEEVPNFFAYPGDDPWKGLADFQDWLSPRGLFYLHVHVSSEWLNRREDMRHILNGYHLLFGRARGLPESSHCVVGFRGVETFNPHPNSNLIFGPYSDECYGLGVICIGRKKEDDMTARL